MIRSLTIIAVATVIACSPSKDRPPGYEEKMHNLPVEEGIHVDSGLKNDPQLPVILANCTACHSAKMITQNRATREGWKNMIVWMQNTQKLWELGENEKIILDYLEKNYAPDSRNSRRANLIEVDWYELD